MLHGGCARRESTSLLVACIRGCCRRRPRHLAYGLQHVPTHNRGDLGLGGLVRVWLQFEQRAARQAAADSYEGSGHALVSGNDSWRLGEGNAGGEEVGFLQVVVPQLPVRATQVAGAGTPVPLQCCSCCLGQCSYTLAVSVARNQFALA